MKIYRNNTWIIIVLAITDIDNLIKIFTNKLKTQNIAI